MVNKIKDYDVIINRCWPGRAFLQRIIFYKTQATSKVLLIEKGAEIQSRTCISDCVNCLNNDKCSVLCGVGGAGLFSDGKLILDLHSGGMLDTVSHITEQKKRELSVYIEKTLRRFDGKSEEGPTPSSEEKATWSRLFEANST